MVDEKTCRDLWCAVLLHACENAMSPKPKRPKRGKQNDKRWRALLQAYAKRVREWGEDRSWIGTRDFAKVCYLAGMNHTAVAERVREKMA